MKNLYWEKEESEVELLVVSDRREVAGVSRSPAGRWGLLWREGGRGKEGLLSI